MAKSSLHAADALETLDDVASGNITGTTIGTKRGLDISPVGADGITDVNGNPIQWDTVAYAEPTTSSETYTYSLDAVDLVVYTTFYTDATKATLAATAITKTAP
jgi:hypothetical protein